MSIELQNPRSSCRTKGVDFISMHLPDSEMVPQRLGPGHLPTVFLEALGFCGMSQVLLNVQWKVRGRAHMSPEIWPSFLPEPSSLPHMETSLNKKGFLALKKECLKVTVVSQTLFLVPTHSQIESLPRSLSVHLDFSALYGLDLWP